jgi:8-oxo-dGTP pyrophosphatase MutT (NUDIX family)
VLETIPTGSRPAARVLLINENNQLLYLQAHEVCTGKTFWVMPGGGLEPGETFSEAAIREVNEETGLHIELGHCIWTRHHIFSWLGCPHDQYEVFFTAQVTRAVINPPQPDEYVIGHKWWSLNQLVDSNESFAPRRIASLLEPILMGDYPKEPFDCGV